MKTLAAALLLFGSLIASPAHAAISAGVALSQPVGFGGFVSFWPSDLLSFDVLATHRVFNAGVTGHIPLSDAAALPAHRLLLAASMGRVYNAFDSYGIGNDVGVALGYGYQAGLDLRLLAGLGGYDGARWAWAPTFTVMAGSMF